MCGIIGYLAGEPRSGFERNIDLLAHRGPDGQGEARGTLGDHCYWFAHRRLSIIDVTGGAQPLAKHGLVMSFNGEIYNYLELADQLSGEHGVQFTTRCDTEVLLEAFRVWGERCLTRLNGMWAFAILNIRTGDLFCARDRLGKKPFYYVHHEGGLFFASEPAALLDLLGRVRADVGTLVGYLLGAQVPHDRSFFENVRKLPPGCSLSYTAGEKAPHIHRYWSVRESRQDHTITFEDACDRIRELVTDAVALRLRSDVGFAVAASGGLDSTIVLATAARVSGATIPTVSVTFDTAFGDDETTYIEDLTKHFSIQPTYAKASAHISVEELLSQAKVLVGVLGEPTPYTSVPYVNKLYRATSAAGFKVLLEGQGADELFGGYTYFRALQQFALLRQWTNLYDFLLALRIRSRPVRTLYFHLNTFHLFLSDQARTLVRMPDLSSTVHTALLNAQEHSILPDLLQYSDRLAMRFGIEVRLPFMDYRLVEFVNSLPDVFKVRGLETKRTLRRAFADGLPATVLERPKIGFGSPTADVLRQHFDLLAKRFVENGTFANSSVFRKGWSRAVRSGFLRTLPNAQRVLWRFILIDYWLERFGAEVDP